LLFAHLCNTSLPKNVLFPLPDNNLKKSFFPLFLLLLLPFNKPMPITYFRIKRPCNSTGTQSLGFMMEREMGDD
jgi:hypothetical protein